jgi:hypothetical protein
VRAAKESLTAKIPIPVDVSQSLDYVHSWIIGNPETGMIALTDLQKGE